MAKASDCQYSSKQTVTSTEDNMKFAIFVLFFGIAAVNADLLSSVAKVTAPVADEVNGVILKLLPDLQGLIAKVTNPIVALGVQYIVIGVIAVLQALLGGDALSVLNAVPVNAVPVASPL